MRSHSFFAAVAAALVALAGPASAATMFTATLTGEQETGPGSESAFGTASLELDDAQARLSMIVTLEGLDLDGLRTPDPADDVIAAHIHRAPFGVAGPVVWGFLGTPFNDTDPTDLVVDPIAGTVATAWDLSEGNATTLAAELANLFAGNLYLNFHTPQFPAGAIRGQILRVPEPAGLGLLGLAMLGLASLRRRTD